MSRPPNNAPGRSQALAGRNITGTINAIAQQTDVNQAYQSKTVTSASTAPTAQYKLIGAVNGTNRMFGLPVKALNGYAIFSDGVQLTLGTQYTASGQSITMTVAPSTSATVLVF